MARTLDFGSILYREDDAVAHLQFDPLPMNWFMLSMLLDRTPVAFILQERAARD
jgi:hypothetical protein